ncbi:Abi-alpha family protein [Aeromonas veronii]
MKENSPDNLTVSEGLLKRILGPAADEVGIILRDSVRAYRQKNLSKILPHGLELVKASKLEPQEIPMRTLIPIIECASIEDNEFLAGKWAGLIASAATAQDTTANHPCFPQILSELSPLDAMILDHLWEPDRPKQWKEFKELQCSKYGLSEKALNMTFASLDRAGLCVNSSEYYFTELGIAFMTAVSGPSSRS